MQPQPTVLGVTPPPRPRSPSCSRMTITCRRVYGSPGGDAWERSDIDLMIARRDGRSARTARCGLSRRHQHRCHRDHLHRFKRLLKAAARLMMHRSARRAGSCSARMI
jgi:hypothetical protein